MSCASEPHCGRLQSFGGIRIERRPAREQFGEKHTEAVGVAARVDLEPARLHLLGAGVDRRADEGVELGDERPVGEALVGRLGDGKVDDLRHRDAVVQRDENIRRFQVAMDDTLTRPSRKVTISVSQESWRGCAVPASK